MATTLINQPLKRCSKSSIECTDHQVQDKTILKQESREKIDKNLDWYWINTLAQYHRILSCFRYYKIKLQGALPEQLDAILY